MDTVALIAEARTLGLTIRADGELLRVRGPKVAEPLALALLDRKPEVLAFLSKEANAVSWRVDALRGHIPVRGPIVLPLLRADVPHDALVRGLCSLCGEPLSEGRRYRCPPCVEAVEHTLNEIREGVPAPNRQRSSTDPGNGKGAGEAA